MKLSTLSTFVADPLLIGVWPHEAGSARPCENDAPTGSPCRDRSRICEHHEDRSPTKSLFGRILKMRTKRIF